MASNQTQPITAAELRALEQSAQSLLTSLKGILDARVETDAHGRIVRVEVVPQAIDDRAAARNAQSALMAVLGQNVDVNRIVALSAVSVAAGEVEIGADVTRIVDETSAIEAPAGVLELKIPPVRNGELNVAARVAFDTLRAAQSSFHGFQFEGAELVRINGHQYVMVAVTSVANDARFCGASPVLESVSTASARALLNAVGTAALGSSAMDLGIAPEYGVLEA